MAARIKGWKQFATGSGALLRQFIASYVLLALLPILFSTISYFLTFDAAKTQVANTNQVILQSTMHIIDNSIKELDSFSGVLNDLTLLDEVLTAPSIGRYGPSRLNEITAALPTFRDTNALISQYYVYSVANGSMWARNQVYTDVRRYYDYGFRYGGMGYDTWEEEILQRLAYKPQVYPVETMLQGGVRTQVMLYIMPYYDKSASRIIGQVVYLLDAGKIQSLMADVYGVEDHSMTILGAEGMTLFQYGSTTPGTAAGGDAMEATAVSKSNGWSYVVSVPRQVVEQEARGNLRLIILSIGITIGITLLLFLTSFLSSAPPLISMARKAAPYGGAGATRRRGGLWALSDQVSTLVENNASLRLQLEYQDQQLRNAFMLRLIHGDYADAQEIEAGRRTWGLAQAAEEYRGIYLHLQHLPQGDGHDAPVQAGIRREAVFQLLEGSGPALRPLMYMRENLLAVLYTDGDDPAALKEQLEQLRSRMLQDYALEGSFAVGEPHTRLHHVHKSFAAAQRRLNNLPEGALGVFLEDGIAADADLVQYEYSARDEALLTGFAETGNARQLDIHLLKIYERNFIRRALPAPMRRLLYYRMLDTLLRLAPAVLDLALLPDVAGWPSEEFFEMIREKYKTACLEFQDRREKEMAQLEHRLVAYIHDNFASSELSLSVLSEQFGFTESYISRLVKNILNENFSAYLERLRIKQANVLLEADELSVTEIAMAVGYTSANSFGRAYNKHVGHSPSQYRRPEP